MAYRVLVTGGAGFIGSHICGRLLGEGYDVICLDNFDDYYDPLLKHKNIDPFLGNKSFQLVNADICDKESISRIISEGVDYVFHNAAQPGVGASVANPMKPHRVNASGTLNILQCCLNTGVKEFVNSSSSSVYGTVQYLPFDEVHPKVPVSPYGVSKLAAEHYCRVFGQVYGLKSVSLRYFTVYGPGMRPDLAISIFVRSALKNETIKIFGSGDKTRDFTYIDDVVEANILATTKGGGGEYNIGSGNRISINELVQKILEITGSRSNVTHLPPRIGDSEHTWANINKAIKQLGWQPKTDIDNGLKKYIADVARG